LHAIRKAEENAMQCTEQADRAILALVNSCKTDNPDIHSNDPEMNDPFLVRKIELLAVFLNN